MDRTIPGMASPARVPLQPSPSHVGREGLDLLSVPSCPLGGRVQAGSDNKLPPRPAAWSPAFLSPVHVVLGPRGLVSLHEHLRGDVAEGAPQSRPLNVLHPGRLFHPLGQAEV